MSFLAFAGGAADAFNKKVEKDRESARSINEMKFGADYNMYLSSVKERTNEKKKHEQGVAYAESLFSDPDKQKIAYKQYMALDGDQKALSEWYKGQDWGAPVDASGLPNLDEWSPTTQIFLTPTLKEYGITDPDKGRTDPTAATFTERDKEFAYEHSRLASNAPLSAHFQSAVEKVQTEDIARSSGVNPEEVAKSGIVPSQSAPPSALYGRNGQRTKPKPSIYSEAASKLTGDSTNDAAIIGSVPAEYQNELKSISEMRLAAKVNESYLMDASNWKSNEMYLENSKGVKERVQVEVATLPNGQKWYRRKGETDLNQYWDSSKNNGVVMRSGLLKADTSTLKSEDIAKLEKDIQPLRDQQNAYMDMRTATENMSTIIERTPGANAKILGSVLGTFSTIRYNILEAKNLVSEEQAFREYNQLSKSQEAQLVSSVMEEYNLSEDIASQFVADARLLEQEQLKYAFAMLRAEGQTGNAVSANELNTFLATISGSPTTMRQMLLTNLRTQGEKVLISYNDVQSKYNSDPRMNRVFRENTAENGKAWLLSGIATQEESRRISEELHPSKKGEDSSEKESNGGTTVIEKSQGRIIEGIGDPTQLREWQFMTPEERKEFE